MVSRYFPHLMQNIGPTLGFSLRYPEFEFQAGQNLEKLAPNADRHLAKGYVIPVYGGNWQLNANRPWKRTPSCTLS